MVIGVHALRLAVAVDEIVDGLVLQIEAAARVGGVGSWVTWARTL